MRNNKFETVSNNSLRQEILNTLMDAETKWPNHVVGKLMPLISEHYLFETIEFANWISVKKYYILRFHISDYLWYHKEIGKVANSTKDLYHLFLKTR